MTKLLMIRHGQSEANLQRIFAGHLDSPLTQLGREQAERTASYIAASYKVDAVYTSDLCRAAAVGKAVSAATGAAMMPMEQLREIRAGEWEGMTFEELGETRPSFQVWLHDIGNSVCDGGESVAQLQKRIISVVRQIAETHPEQTVVITTHYTPIRAMLCYCQGKPLAELKDTPRVSNTSITELDYEDGRFFVIRAGFDGHLGDAVTVLPPTV